MTSTCRQAQAALSGYVADYNTGKANADAYKANIAALPTMSALPIKPLPTTLGELLATPTDNSEADAVMAWQRALQRYGVGRNLPADGNWSADWESAVSAYGNRDSHPAQRAETADASLAYAVVDQNPSCFSPEVRAQVKVNE